MRWNPSTFTVTEEPLEVVCESSTTFDELRTLVAKAVQLGDDEHGATDIADIGIAKRGRRMDSVLDVPGLEWDADREDPDKMDAYSRAAASDIGFISDGDVFLYKDNREELKELTEDERKKLKTESRAKKVGASQETVRISACAITRPTNDAMGLTFRLYFTTSHFSLLLWRCVSVDPGSKNQNCAGSISTEGRGQYQGSGTCNDRELTLPCFVKVSSNEYLNVN